ncbi:hypothetical protein N0V82_004836 [Gnomoniopsis sp. IMI 355080]|nr:hypothetical protein N0V82_004836 [Gnomoniopsis sp. IMI 355080]
MESILRAFSFTLLPILFSIPTAAAKDTQYISGTSITGVTQQLDVARTPALYTGNFGDCLEGQSLFNITKFDAAYYTDNSTVLFHLDGQSSIKNESLLMRISMTAYGEERFSQTFDPCSVNINSLCPLNASLPIEAWAVFPVGVQQVGDIPSLAFSILDFEGSVKMQIFGNSTQSEIGCFQASLTNGNTMAHPRAISPVLALFVLVAMLASFATAVYGVSIPAMRSHYAHSLSVLVIFEAFQSIFFSGALQLDFPSVLPAWWSNFAWASGQIFSQSVVETASVSSGLRGNASQAGGAGSSIIDASKSGASIAQQVYGRSIFVMSETSHQLSRRYNASDPFDYTWAGSPVGPGLVLPGTWLGFPGTLSALRIPAADTFAIGLIWLLALIGALVAILIIFKVSLEVLVMLRWIGKDSLAFFRSHWAQYTVATVLRTLFVAFTMIMTLASYQLSLDGSAGTKALAAVFFLAFLLGLGTLAAHACYIRLRGGNYAVQQDRMLLILRKKSNLIPYLTPIRMSTLEKSEQLDNTVISLPWLQLHYHDNNPTRITVHQDELYIQRFGWLVARYRRTRWWFFAVYLAYQLFRAAIVGGGSSTPMAQVYLLLIYDIVAFFIILAIDPFEGRRNTALAVWMLGISKILTTALSIAFLPTMNVNRIIATALGIIIIVIQGLLTIGLMILVVIGVMSSYMSITRDREPFNGEPSNHKEVNAVRARYMSHLEKRGVDIRTTPAERKRLQQLEREAEMNAIPPEPSFTVKSVRRVPKIYDEDDDVVASLEAHSTHLNKSRPVSIQSVRSTHSNLPRGARALRASWSSQDFAEWDMLSSKMSERPNSITVKRLSSYSGYNMFQTNLYSFQEEDDDADRRVELNTNGGGSLEPKRPLTPASDKPSSRTAVMTPDMSRDGNSSLKGIEEPEHSEERADSNSHSDGHDGAEMV